MANDEKSQWVPSQSGELLGDFLDLHIGKFHVPQKTVSAFHQVLQNVLTQRFVVTA